MSQRAKTHGGARGVGMHPETLRLAAHVQVMKIYMNSKEIAEALGRSRCRVDQLANIDIRAEKLARENPAEGTEE